MLKSITWRRISTLLFLAALVLVSACGGDDDPVQLPEDPTVEPRSPFDLLLGFQTAYADRDLKTYLALLDPEFRFFLHPLTVNLYPELAAGLDLTREEQIHERMFSGEGVIDPDLEPRPGVQQIYFNEFQPLDTWKTTDDPTNFPEATWALFDLDMVIDCGQNFTTYEARGQVKIYIREYTRMAGGKEIKYYKLAGMLDLTQSDKGVERTPWGLIKVFYR